MKKTIPQALWENKGKLTAGSLAVLLPALCGGRMMAQSLGLLAAHWLVAVIVLADRRNREGQSKKALGLVFWLMPALSLLLAGVEHVLRRSGGAAADSLMALGMGLLFLVVGNYMPKFRQNSFMGIRVPWTLHSEANWAATHRFGGKVWAAGGLACMACALLPSGAMAAVFPALLAVLVALPIGYAWRFHRREMAAGTASPTAAPTPADPRRRALGAAGAVALAAVVLWALFAGSFEAVCGGDALTVTTRYWEGLTLPYADIVSVEYQPGDTAPDGGARSWGFGNLRVGLGSFFNDAYGDYTRYTYAACPDTVVLRCADGRVVVLNAPDPAATRALCEELAARVG